MKHLKTKTTRDYAKFSYLPMNREVQASHVESMVKSLRKMGCIRDVIVVYTNILEGIYKTYIVDGQHLFNGLIRENMAIAYRTITVKTEKDLVENMAALNNTSKSWKLLDYINAYKVIYTDYMKLLKYINMYNLEPTMIAMIGTKNYKHSGGLSKLIKSGDFTITNNKTEEMCKAFSDIFIKIGKADRWVKFNFLDVFATEYDTYNHATTLKNVEKHISTIKAMADPIYAKEFIRKKIFN
jgi:hypothetical protein